ncbi:MAG: hypothetical protein ACXVEF_41415 [Polyangiales bacterium]
MRFSHLSLALLVGTLFTAAACGGSTEEAPQAPADDDFSDESPADDGGVLDDGLGDLLDDAGLDDAGSDDGGTTPTEDAGSSADASTPPEKPTCDSTAKNGDYCAGDKVSHGTTGTLYHCTGPSVPATVVSVCKLGCEVAAGSDDYCKVASPTADSCPHVSAILKWGLHPIASDRLRCAGITAGRITQTIGSAAASAGTHAQDGTYEGHAYSAATDLSVSGLSDAQVKTLIAKLDALGFAAFYRNPGHDGWPSSEVRHVHAVFAGAYMKSSLRAQIADFLAGKNGLASHTAYTFYQPSAAVKAYVKKIFDAAN